MDILFISGFGPIAQDPAETLHFWSETIGLPFDEIAPDYYHAHELEGAKVFALWPLSQAAESTFGSREWPHDVPVPQSWIELELELELASPDAVSAGVDELTARGQRVLAAAKTEEWGQTTARLLSPEGMLVGLSFMPPFHES